MGALQGILDLNRVAMNSATFGLPDRIAAAVMGRTAAEAQQGTAEAHDRLGIGGDVAAGVGAILPTSLAFKGGALALRGLGLARAAAPEAAAAAKGVLGFIKNNPKTAALTAFLGTGAARGGRLEPAAQAAVPEAAAAPAAAAVAAPAAPGRLMLPPAPKGGRDAAGNLSIHSDEGLRYVYDVQRAREAAAGVRQGPAAAPAAEPERAPFQAMLQAFGGEGGGISLNELAALAQAENHSRPTTSKRTPTGKDVAASALMQMADQQYNASAAAIAKMPAGADRDRAIESAAAARMSALRSILDPNPMDNVLAERMAEPE